MRTETKRNLAICIVILLMLSPILVSRAVATDDGLNLPSTPIQIEASNGTESYLSTSLSDVPSGYDVMNGTYLGWCVDKTAEMGRSPATHEVELYSSINPPGTLESEKWGMVNYILNHKQGTMDDIQQAIWYFINMLGTSGNFTPTSTVAMVIVNDTLANGTGFVPENGQTIAVICFPMVLIPEPVGVQITIIEVANKVIPEFPSSAIPLLFLVITLSMVIIHRRRYLLTHAR
ncbi:hypothetical protein MUP01_11250 [Candidatus Bathyarchaeota archaeon]|nr:hypothetical protein [Candidatus Bathyarchaeota archaeon]